MIIKTLTIKNFRNHSYLTYDFFDKINVFLGDNGIGKTRGFETLEILLVAHCGNHNDTIITVERKIK